MQKLSLEDFDLEKFKFHDDLNKTIIIYLKTVIEKVNVDFSSQIQNYKN
jgi:hypothetical protein